MARGPVTGVMVVPTLTEASACSVAAAIGAGPAARGPAEGEASADGLAEGEATAGVVAADEVAPGVAAPGRECVPLAVHAETASSAAVAAPAVQTRARFMRVRRRRRGQGCAVSA
jgi:hypothetical protein